MEKKEKYKEKYIKGFTAIGEIRTPYHESAPFQPKENDEGEFCLELYDTYSRGLQELDHFNYIFVLFYLDRHKGEGSLTAHPPWLNGHAVGVFASRSPNRPNPIGMSIVKITSIEGNRVYVQGIDAFDRTPLLDIKPYIHELDSKQDSNAGWMRDEKAREHLMEHIRGIPHSHS